MTKPTLEQLEAAIVKLERRTGRELKRLSLLKRQRRSFVAAAAAEAAKQRPEREDQGRLRAGDTRTYRLRKEVAHAHRLSPADDLADRRARAAGPDVSVS